MRDDRLHHKLEIDQTRIRSVCHRSSWLRRALVWFAGPRSAAILHFNTQLVPKQFPNVATRSQTFPSISKTIPNSFPNGSQSLLKCGSHLSHAVFASVCAIDWQCVFY